MTITENTIASPAIEKRCTTLLEDTLTGYAGITQVDFNFENGHLKAAFDPNIISQDQVMHLVRKSGEEAYSRVAHCAAKAQYGEEACSHCTLELSQRLQTQFQTIAGLPEARIVGNEITATLNQTLVMSHETSDVELTLSMQEKKRVPPRGKFSTEQIEIIFTVLTAVTGIAGFVASLMSVHALVVGLLYTAAYAFGGYFGLLESITALKAKTLNVDLLMILASIGAAIIGQPAEGAILLFLFSLSNTLQSYAMDRSRKAIEKLLDLRPATALRKQGDTLTEVSIDRLRLGDVVVVRPGERFPIDGQVLAGESQVDQSPITGESIPVRKTPGDEVFAGTVNGSAALEIRVNRLAEDTTLARIVKMVEEAQSTKANTQRMLDNFEEVYAIFVLGAATLLVIIPYFIMGQAFDPVFYRAMTWLVVASPCALVISTPASFLSAIANAARQGVLFKGGAHMERAAELKVVAFDKTGTLTNGTPQLMHLKASEGVDEGTFLQWVAAVESRSEHPLANAIVQAAQKRGIELPSAVDFRALVGQGVEGKVEGNKIWIGNERLYAERGLTVPQYLLDEMCSLEDTGQTVMLAYNATAATWLGTLALADTLREDALQMVTTLKNIGIKHVVMLTGDNARVAAEIADRAGVDEYHAGLLPQDKVTALKRLQNQYGPVAMVGDGVNDAPSLATADVGIAMGGAGTDVAIETADIVLMSDDLSKIPFTIELARRAKRVVWQNLTFSLAVIVLLVAGAFGIHMPLPLGVVGHEGSTVIVVINGLRLLKYKV